MRVFKYSFAAWTRRCPSLVCIRLAAISAHLHAYAGKSARVLTSLYLYTSRKAPVQLLNCLRGRQSGTPHIVCTPSGAPGRPANRELPRASAINWNRLLRGTLGRRAKYSRLNTQPVLQSPRGASAEGMNTLLVSPKSLLFSPRGLSTVAISGVANERHLSPARTKSLLCCPHPLLRSRGWQVRMPTGA